MRIQQRTETLRFMGSRPNEERIAEKAARYLPGWDVVRIGPLTVARNRRGSTAFDVRVTYRHTREAQ